MGCIPVINPATALLRTSQKVEAIAYWIWNSKNSKESEKRSILTPYAYYQQFSAVLGRAILLLMIS